MNIKRNVIFTPESRKKDGVIIMENVPVRMRVIFSGKRVDFSTGHRIDVAKWDYGKQRVKKGCINRQKQSSSDINADLNKYEAMIQAIFKEYEVVNTLPTPAQIKAVFNERVKAAGVWMHVSEVAEMTDKPVSDFWTIYDGFVKESGRLNNWALATFRKFGTVRNHLCGFMAHRGGELSFDVFTEDGLNDYVDFLRDVEGMRNMTIGKHVAFLKWYLRWAAKKGHNANPAFASFKLKLKHTQKKVIFLTTDELARLRDCEIPATKRYLERVRDIFLFLCFSGLRYSDVANLRRSDIKDDHIEVTTIKTADSLCIEFNSYTRAILEKYKEGQFVGNRVLPIITNQKFNEYLKELGKLAGIDEPIRETYYRGNERIDTVMPKYALLGSHAGRRTFICNALSLGIPPQVVMKWTGHSDYKAMKPYIDIADNIKAQAMTKFDDLLNRQ